MINGVDIEEVKRYNASLKQYQDKAAQIRAGIEYNTQELNRLCAELSAEIGIQVTPENIRQIRDERIAKIKNTLEAGNGILNRIRDEEANLSSTAAINQNTAVNSLPTVNIGQIPSAPAVGSIPVAPVAPTVASQPIAPTDANIGNIPPIFSR